jgi:hypothetical protein
MLEAAKISEGFRERLKGLGAEDRVRAVVLLDEPHVGKAGVRQSGAERAGAVKSAQESANTARGEIEDVIQRFGGSRLVGVTGTLGALVLETTRAGIEALTSLPGVKAILEDQGIRRG